MININLVLEPHLGVPIVNRAESEASRLYRAAKKDDRHEAFERHLADAYAGLLSGGSSKPSQRPELVVLVSHEIAARGWKDVREGEECKIPEGWPGVPTGGQGDCFGCLSHRSLLRRQGPQTHAPLDPQNARRGPSR